MLARQTQMLRSALLFPTLIFMLKSPLLFAIATSATLLSWTGIAQANEDNLALDFALPANSPAQLPSNLDTVIPAKTVPEAASSRVSSNLANPVVLESSQTPLALSSQEPIQTLSKYSDPLPSLNPEPTVQVKQNTAPNIEPNIEPKIALQPHNQKSSHQNADIALSFADNSLEMPSIEATTVSALEPAIESTVESTPEPTTAMPDPKTAALQNLRLDDWIFEGGTSSLVAHTVGKAEGTRSADGQRTQAFYGHQDPGNGVWNIGTFSYQHAAQSPEEADEKQLARLKNQALQLEAQAKAQGIELSLEAKLNGIDLANQAPLAALDRGGYIEQLAKAYRLNMSGTEAIVWARTYAYLDPDTRQWNAPGLGNNVDSIDRDQRRRVEAIAQARSAYDDPRFSELNLDRLSDITLAPNNSPETVSNQSSSSPEIAFESSDQTSESGTVTTSDNPLKPSELSFGLPPSNRPSEEANNAEAVVSMIAPKSDVERSYSDDDVSSMVQGAAANSLTDAVTVTSPEANLAILPVPPIPIPVSSSAALPANAMPVVDLELENSDNQEAAIASGLPLPAPLAETASVELERPAPQPNLERQQLWHFEDKVGRQVK